MDEGQTKKIQTRGRRRSKAGRLCSEITLEELALHYHQSIEVAAAEMRVGVTALKKLCRKFKVFKWPYRKFQRILRLTGVAKAGMARLEDYQRLTELVMDPQLGEHCPLWHHVDTSERYVLQAVFAASKHPTFKGGFRQQQAAVEAGDDDGQEGDRDEDVGASVSETAARLVQKFVSDFAEMGARTGARNSPVFAPQPRSAAFAANGAGYGTIKLSGDAQQPASDVVNNPFLAQAMRLTGSLGPGPGGPGEDSSSASNAAALQSLLADPRVAAALMQRASMTAGGDCTSRGRYQASQMDPQMAADSLPRLLEAIRNNSVQSNALFTANSLLNGGVNQWDVAAPSLGAATLDFLNQNPNALTSQLAAEMRQGSLNALGLPSLGAPPDVSPFRGPAPFLPSVQQDNLLGELRNALTGRQAENNGAQAPVSGAQQGLGGGKGAAASELNSQQHQQLAAALAQHSLGGILWGPSLRDPSLNLGSLHLPSLAQGSLDDVMKSLLGQNSVAQNFAPWQGAASGNSAAPWLPSGAGQSGGLGLPGGPPAPPSNAAGGAALPDSKPLMGFPSSHFSAAFAQNQQQLCGHDAQLQGSNRGPLPQSLYSPTEGSHLRQQGTQNSFDCFAACMEKGTQQAAGRDQQQETALMEEVLKSLTQGGWAGQGSLHSPNNQTGPTAGAGSWAGLGGHTTDEAGSHRALQPNVPDAYRDLFMKDMLRQGYDAGPNRPPSRTGEASQPRTSASFSKAHLELQQALAALGSVPSPGRHDGMAGPSAGPTGARAPASCSAGYSRLGPGYLQDPSASSQAAEHASRGLPADSTAMLHTLQYLGGPVPYR